MTEISMIHDRLNPAERVVDRRGLDLATGIKKLELDLAALEAWRRDFVERILD